MPAACVYMRVNDVQKKWIFNWRVIGDVDCCVCVWGTTGVKSALAITATSRSQSCRPARLLPAGASSPKTHRNRRGVTRPQEHTTRRPSCCGRYLSLRQRHVEYPAFHEPSSPSSADVTEGYCMADTRDMHHWSAVLYPRMHVPASR